MGKVNQCTDHKEVNIVITCIQLFKILKSDIFKLIIFFLTIVLRAPVNIIDIA